MRHLIVLIIAITCCADSSAAQSMSRHGVFERYQQVNWQERDGLPQNTVVAIAATRDGYVWVGTYEGAARFDGVRFTLFNPSNTAGLGNSFVTSLLERRDGDLWLGTCGGGVSRLSGGRFTQYATRDELSTDFVLCLFEDHAGTLWIGADGGGLNAFSRGQESLNNVVRHSQAGEAHVAVHCHEHHVEITIRDNGQGFAAGASNAGATHRGGFGLKGLAERVHMLGGTHTIESGPGRGTTVSVRLVRRSPGEGGIAVDASRQEPAHGE